jgi:hypothetical protein
MKRMLIAALAGALLFILTTPVQAQGGFGRGRGPRWSQGGASWSRPMGMGMRIGMGPGAFRGTCPRFACSRGRGLRDGTGPRAQNGTCLRFGPNAPGANAPAASKPPAPPVPPAKR